VSVLSDIDLVPDDNGVQVVGAGTAAAIRPVAVHVTWAELAEATGGLDPLSPAGRCRATTLLRGCQLLADRGGQVEEVRSLLRNAARALALPAGHALHPGPDWVQGPLRGGALDLGIGLLGLGGTPDDVQPLPPVLVRRLGLQPQEWWPDLQHHVERMGGLSAVRIARDGHCVLRPVGGCDALTLLASSALRDQLVAGDGTGMRAVAVPDRRRAWFDLAQIDPAFTAAVWSITPETDRGLPAPVLVTRHEVALPVPDGDVIATSLGRPAPFPAPFPLGTGEQAIGSPDRHDPADRDRLG
jgi:hypothetical protein